MQGYAITKDQYRVRLKRIEGQVRGLERMIEADTYCMDVLAQVSAVTGALNGIAVGLLDQHVAHCVTNAAADGDPEHAREMVTEATRAIERLIRS